MRIKIFTFATLLCIGQMAFAGGGWPQLKNRGFFKLSQFVLSSNKYYAPSGDILDIATAGVFITSFYGEYGLTDRLTAIAYVPFFARTTLNEQVSGLTGSLIAAGDASNSFGDTDLTLKYGLITNKPIVISASLTFGIPLGNASGGDTGVLQTGDGEFNQMVTLEASRSFAKGKTYVSTLLGFNNRSKNFSDELRYGLEVGYTVSPKVFVALKLNGVKSLRNGSDLEAPSNGIFSNNLEYLALTPEVSYSFNEKFGISGSVGTALSGRRILAKPAYSLGFFLKI